MEKYAIVGHQVVCSAFIEKDKKFLIVMCPKFKVWRVPGGRPEYGEKVEKTLIREMQEEVGISFENPIFVGFGQDIQLYFIKQKETSRLILYFYVKTNEELIIDSDEAEEYKWVSIEEMKKIENKEGALNDFFKRNPNFGK
ncbi:NUDIX hydrolase [Candidatus Gracilibacteria bacterium]|nr:NUDIX hydrolase [Candidatus Gracilibacteria bacterium]NUJ98994.1 NUDIX hydrolase [Candidatus Gracilibacteria bacterium]